tara:strand:- start:3924 stop:4307 length:384 start_codon:yes stop_codon:yes gene_type:complete
MSDVTIFFSGYNSITQRYSVGGYESDVAFTGLTLAQGSATSSAGATVPVTGQSVSSSLGSVAIVEGVGPLVEVVGNEVTIGTQDLKAYWQGIVPGQTAQWNPLVPGQTAQWNPLSASQSPIWTEIAT